MHCIYTVIKHTHTHDVDHMMKCTWYLKGAHELWTGYPFKEQVKIWAAPPGWFFSRLFALCEKMISWAFYSRTGGVKLHPCVFLHVAWLTTIALSLSMVHDSPFFEGGIFAFLIRIQPARSAGPSYSKNVNRADELETKIQAWIQLIGTQLLLQILNKAH